MIKILNALAEPKRLQIIELLKAGPRSVGEIVDELGLYQVQVSKHLRILVEAGLVETQRDAQRRIYRLRQQPFEELDAWLESFLQVWNVRLDRLDEHLRELQEQPHQEK